MKAIETTQTGRSLVVRLDPGDDVLEAIQRAVDGHGMLSAAVVSGIGTLRDARLHMVTTTTYPAVETFPEWHDEPLELVSISGLVLSGQPHLHGVISTSERAVGGHIEPGCIVLYLGEVLLVEVGTAGLSRRPDANGVQRIDL